MNTVPPSNLKVKFVPVSGRPAGYVLRVLHDTRDMLSSMDVGKVCDFGAAEQGALLVDCSRSYGPQFIGDTKNLGLKQKIDKIIKANPFAKIVKDEPDKIYTCSIHIVNEAKAKMDHAAQRKVYESIRDDIWMEFGKDTLDISMSHNCMEVMSKEISKAKAVDVLLWRYRQDYNVVGMLYAGKFKCSLSNKHNSSVEDFRLRNNYLAILTFFIMQVRLHPAYSWQKLYT